MVSVSQHLSQLLESNRFDKVKMALVFVILEKALLDIGAGAYHKVAEELKKRYHCHLEDCYEHPEYLNAILKDLYGDSYKHIVKSIDKKLAEFSYYKSIARFLEVISQ